MHITESRIAWLAALIDGEGSVMVLRGSKKPGDIYVKVQITNTFRPLLELVHELVGGHIEKPNVRGSWKPRYTWYLWGKKSIAFLGMVEPWLVVKKARAKEILSNSRMFYTYSRKKPLSATTVRAREALRKRVLQIE